MLLPGTATNLGIVFNASSTGTSAGTLALGNNASIGGYYVVNLLGIAYPSGYMPPVTNTQPPLAFNDTFHVQANSANNILNPLANDFDTNNYPLTITSVTSTNGGTAVIINGASISYTPPRGIRSETNSGVALPADGFYYTISDGHGGASRATVYIIIDASDIPVVTLLNPPTSYSTNAGSLVPIIASVVPPENVTKLDFYLDSSLIGEVTNSVNNLNGFYTNYWAAVFANDGYSHHDIYVQATDKYGQMGPAGFAQITVTTNGLPSATLVASLESETNSNGGGTKLNLTTNISRDGLFRLYGRAYHSLGSNVVWQLGVYTPDGTLVRNLTPPSSGAVGSSVTNGLLLNCDLTTLMNGVYTLTLTVNGGYQLSETSVPIQLESNLKLGQFSFNQQDLIIPISGSPLTVTRTYNSIKPDKGDFGYGWTYALSDMDVSLDETRDDAIDLDGNRFSQRSGGSWDVTLNLPNGQRTTFYFTLGIPNGLGTYQATRTPSPCDTAKLTAQGDNRLETLIGSLTGNSTLFYWDATGPGTPWQTYDFPGFVLTTLDGTQYIVTRDDLDDHFMDDGGEGYYIQAYGNAHLSSIIERSLDSISINPSSIVYTATNGATRQIVFQRNADGLISSISDPNGLAGGVTNGPPAVQYQYDSSDNLINVLNLVDRNGAGGAGTYVTNSFSYTNVNFVHYITGIINADGTQVAQNFYDDNGKLTAVQDANGNLTRFIHNLTNNMDVIIDRRGFTNTYVYDARGNITIQTNQLGQITTMAYDNNNNKTNEVMYLGTQAYATNTSVFDPNNLMLSSTDALGNTNGFVYDYIGKLVTSADAFGHTTVTAYDGSGQLISTTDALGHGTTNFYGGSQMFGSVDALGTATTNFYDPSTGYLTGTSTRDVASTILSSNTFTCDGNGNRLTSTVWRSGSGGWTPATTLYGYDAMNRVVTTVNPDGGTNTVVYNSIGKQQATIDPLGHTTSFGYDSQGRLIQTTFADSTTEKSAYDANGNRFQSIDRANRTTTYVYDALNRLTNTIYTDNTTSSTIYDGVGRVAQTLDALGTITAFNYDVAGRRVAVTNAFGTTVAMTSFNSYDANGNQITFTDGLGHTTTNVFDILNRQVQTIYPNGTTNSTVYDVVGRRVVVTNQDGVATFFGYDGASRLTSVTNALSQVTRYQYDEAGNEIAQIDALNRTNLFAYDGMGRRVLHTAPDRSISYPSESFTYDVAGNLTAHTNFWNHGILSQYDVMNRLTNRFSDNYDVKDSYSYTATGQRRSMVDNFSGNSVVYNYDNRDRLIQKGVAWNYGPTGALNYGYDANGNMTNMVSGYANGTSLAYGYDPLNRLTNVLSHGQLAAVYGYDGAGNLQGMRYGNGVTNLYQYDTLIGLTNLVWETSGSVSALASFAYQLKGGGTRTNLVESINSSAPTTCQWSYDSLYRLTNEVVGAGSLGYQYDTVGNRLGRTSIGVPQLPTDVYSYGTNDELAMDTNGTFSYDYDGNTQGAPGGNSYAYDSVDRLVSGNSAGINYNGDDNRASKVVGSTTTYYLVDDRNPSGYPQVVEEYQTDPTLAGQPVVLSRVYNYGLALISQQQFDTNTLQPSTLSYYGYDGHGSVRFLTSTNGTVTDTYTYDAYGTLIVSNGSTPNKYLYCGQVI